MFNKRKIIQIFISFLNNSYLLFPFTKNIYHGKLKFFCSPGLNCYSCPASIFSCPIGAIQNILASLQFNLSLGKYFIGLYVWGFLGTIGILGGRIVCGWACPFGLFQEIIYKIPTRKYKFNINFLTYLKYVLLIFMVILLPAFFVDKYGYGELCFCKYFCPAGTLEAGLTLPFLISSLQSMLGLLFLYKFVILLFLIILFIITKRPFCRFFCPLGAIYSIFNRFSFFKLEKDMSKCTECNICAEVCPMNLSLDKIPNSSNCIRCFNCVKACPSQALKLQ